MHYSNADAGVGGLSLREVAMCVLASFEESSSGEFTPQVFPSQSLGILELTGDCCVTCSFDCRAQ